MTTAERNLARGNRVRLAAAEVKRDIRAGRVSLGVALWDERADCVEVHDLLIAQRYWGSHRAATLLARVPIFDARRVRDLTDRQRVRIIELAAG